MSSLVVGRQMGRIVSENVTGVLRRMRATSFFINGDREKFGCVNTWSAFMYTAAASGIGSDRIDPNRTLRS